MRILDLVTVTLFIAGSRAGQAASALRGANQETEVKNPLSKEFQHKPSNLRGGDNTAEYTSMLPGMLENTIDGFVKNITSTENPLTTDVAKSSNLIGGDNTAEYTRMLPDTLDKITADVVNLIKNDGDFRKLLSH